MSHISYSELKDWAHCPFYHKLTRIDGIDGFTGNQYTAFGSAIHSVCEKKLLKQDLSEDYFVKELKKNISELDEPVDNKTIHDMMKQGNKIIPEIDDALNEYFDEFEVLAVELPLYEPIENEERKFKGYIDAVVATPDGKVHIFDWKTCSWGWNAKKRSEPMITYQLTLYKFFFCQKMDIDPKNVETHFALLKRTAKKNNVEIFRVTSGRRKIANATELLIKGIRSIKSGLKIKNRNSCTYCEFRHTNDCPR